MYISNEINAVIDALKSSSTLSDTYIIAAFPYTYKPTRLDKCVLTVSPHSLDVKTEGIGENHYYGDVGIRVDAFVPQDAGSPCVTDILGNVTNVLSAFYPNEIKMSGIKVRNDLECFTAYAVYVFKTRIAYGGNNG